MFSENIKRNLMGRFIFSMILIMSMIFVDSCGGGGGGSASQPTQLTSLTLSSTMSESGVITGTDVSEKAYAVSANYGAISGLNTVTVAPVEAVDFYLYDPYMSGPTCRIDIIGGWCAFMVGLINNDGTKEHLILTDLQAQQMVDYVMYDNVYVGPDRYDVAFDNPFHTYAGIYIEFHKDFPLTNGKRVVLRLVYKYLTKTFAYTVGS